MREPSKLLESVPRLSSPHRSPHVEGRVAEYRDVAPLAVLDLHGNIEHRPEVALLALPAVVDVSEADAIEECLHIFPIVHDAVICKCFNAVRVRLCLPADGCLDT